MKGITSLVVGFSKLDHISFSITVLKVVCCSDGFERRFHEQNVEHMLASSLEAFEYTEGSLIVEQNEGGFYELFCMKF